MTYRTKTAEKLVAELRKRSQGYADNANYSRASYCAGRAGCDEIRDIRNKPEDYLEWKAADEIEFWMKAKR